MLRNVLWVHVEPKPVANSLSYQVTHPRTDRISADRGANDVTDTVPHRCSANSCSYQTADAKANSRAHVTSKPSADKATDCVTNGRADAASVKLSVQVADIQAVAEPDGAAYIIAVRISILETLRLANKAADRVPDQISVSSTDLRPHEPSYDVESNISTFSVANSASDPDVPQRARSQGM